MSSLTSFVSRSRSLTAQQQLVFQNLWKRYGLCSQAGFLENNKIFGRSSPCLLEIGFGTGESLLSAAKMHTDKDFIGVEVYRTGIFSLLLHMEKQCCTNLRLYQGGAIPILTSCILDQSLAGIQIFFPDPWPKRRHHKRRLIQADFAQILLKKIGVNGTLHLATDCLHYAEQMRLVMAQCSAFHNLAPQYSPWRSVYRPVMSKFERRGVCSGRKVWELHYVRCI